VGRTRSPEQLGRSRTWRARHARSRRLSKHARTLPVGAMQKRNRSVVLRTTRNSPGSDCRIPARRKYAAGRSQRCRPTVSTTALPVAEQSGQAGAVTGIGVEEPRWRRSPQTCLCCCTSISSGDSPALQRADSATAATPTPPRGRTWAAWSCSPRFAGRSSPATRCWSHCQSGSVVRCWIRWQAEACSAGFEPAETSTRS
jgi:hypothetical protein